MSHAKINVLKSLTSPIWERKRMSLPSNETIFAPRRARPGSLLCLFVGVVSLDASTALATGEAPYDPSPVRLQPHQRASASIALGARLLSADDPSRISPRAGNLAAAPTSLVKTMEMLWWGSRGETAVEIARWFTEPGAHGTVPVHQTASQNESDGLGGLILLKEAASLWLDSTVSPKVDYLRLLNDRGLGPVTSVDWSGGVQDAVRKVNAWCYHETGGRLPTLLQPSDIRPPARLILASVIAMESSWLQSFDETHTEGGDFISWDGIRRPAYYMRSKRSTRVARTSDGTLVLELPFAGGSLSLLCVLPAAGAPAANAEKIRALGSRLSSSVVRHWMDEMLPEEVDVHLPRFSIQSRIPVQPALEALGVRKIFGAGTADLSGLADSKGLALSAVFQSAAFRVTEKGAAGASASAGVVSSKSFKGEEVEFRADRPFLFLLVNRQTLELHFIGRVAVPDSSSVGGL